ncbi:hypothetical protein [Curtobacterium sp. Leaf261]|uniref:hypothetical protein n=1 Tax=Curtobacterium sp. Leaf261 TaxID=1736311 RepID=UPI0006F83438|nr:hypothetical protein [Curtobacterium sp. Leaf261]KQO62399.1 hypothetical protein ASF23_11540 [Curtobacterium sp. Leaf261]
MSTASAVLTRPGTSTPDDAIAGPDVLRERFALRSRARLTTLARIAMVVAAVVCAVTLPTIPGASSTTLGLLFAGVPGVAISIAVAGLAFVLALRAGAARDAWAATIVAVLCMRLPIALGAGAPMYSWTYKHLGVIDWIQHHGHVATGVDIYSGWPGVFAAIAWFSTVTGISPTFIAQWFEVGVNLALVIAVGALARSLGSTRLTAVTAAFVAGIANWVGQDYLSPQAVAFLLGIVVVVLIVRSRTRPVLAWVSVPVFGAIAVSHQLTPYWLIAVTVCFGLIGAARPRWIGIVFGAIALAMVVVNLNLVEQYTTGAAFDPVANAQTIVTGTGSIGQTVTSYAARALTAGVWGATLVTVVVGLRPNRFGGNRIRRWMTLRLAILAFAPFALLAGQSYGGEAIFRVFLYSLPGCAILLAPVVVRCVRAGRTASEQLKPASEQLEPASDQQEPASGPHGQTVPGRDASDRDAPVVGMVGLPSGSSAARPARRTAAVVGGRLALAGSALAVVLASMLSAQATYGAWFANLVTPQSLSVSTDLLRTMPVPSQVVSPIGAGAGRMTEQYVDQARIDPGYDSTMDTWAGWIGQSFRNPAVETKLTSDLQQSDRPVYMLFTEQMFADSDYHGTYPAGALQRFASQVGSDSRWESIVAAPGVELYRLKGTVR